MKNLNFETINLWLFSHGFQLNNREWSALLWISIFVVFGILNPQVRSYFLLVTRSAASPKLLVLWGSFSIWMVFFVTLAQQANLWDQRLTKDTLLWTITAGLVLLASFTKAHNAGFFRKALWKILGVFAFLEYLMSLNSFPLAIEFFLQLLIPFFILAPIHAEEKVKWKNASSIFFSILTIALLTNTAYFLISSRHSIDLDLFILKAGWPIVLSIWLLPLIYILALISVYQQAFLRLRLSAKDQQNLWKAKLGLAFVLRARLKWIDEAAKGRTYYIANASSLKAATGSAMEFKYQVLNEERKEKLYQKNLARLAGSTELDEQGRPIDKREFRETRKTLDWLHTCHMGWFRRNPIGYKTELLTRIGGDFTNRGLPNPSGIVMKVSTDGTKWYAWRRTIGGHYFSIGANGEPPNRWRYDGCCPPIGFPGETPEWGSSPFEDEAAPNWIE